MNKQGFTLLELILSGFLFATIAALVTAFGVYFFNNYSFSFKEQQQIGQAQTALTQMIREIRKAQTGDNGAWPLVQTDDTTFIFYADVNGDGKAEKIRYFLNGNELDRGVTPPTAVPVTYPPANEVVNTIVSNVSTGSAIFQYYDGNWPSDQINNPLVANQRILNTRFVRVILSIDTAPNFATQPFTISSGVTILSMKSNL